MVMLWQHRAVPRGHESGCPGLAIVPLCNSVACVTPGTHTAGEGAAGPRGGLAGCIYVRSLPWLCHRVGVWIMDLIYPSGSRVLLGSDQPRWEREGGGGWGGGQLSGTWMAVLG